MARKSGNTTSQAAAEFAAQQLAAIVESSDDAIVSKNLDGIIMTWNRGAERVFGYGADEVIGKPITILIPVDRHHEEETILARLRRGERIEHYETVRQRKNGEQIDVSLTVSPIKDGEGKVVGASKIARDITERKRAEERFQLLAREADHRAKNLLALVQATVHLAQADTPQGLKKAIEGRIQAIANAHNLFAQSRWSGANLRTLVVEELAPYGKQGEKRIEILGTDLILEPTTGQSMAIALHELATNAVKYGALSVPEGRVRIEWFRMPDAQFAFRWSENGGPPVAPPRRHGVGMRVIEQMIKTQMKGELRLDWRQEGLACEIVLPELARAAELGSTGM
jgi:PAS domain S-box-containing protein